jgi:DNA-binding CsgD family transcriptional regulator/PAS domain-containing protein
MPRSGTARGRAISAAETDSGLLSSLYESAGKADGWATFIDALALSYAGGKGTLCFNDAGARHSVCLATGQWEPEQVARYNQYYGAINPWLSSGAGGNRPIGVVVTSEHVLPRSDLLKTEHYNDYLRPAEVDDGVAVTIRKDSARYFAVTVLFPQTTAERDPHIVGRLQRLVPHMLRVTQLNRQLAAFETRGIAAEAALDRLVTAMMVVNAAGYVVYANAAAERIITAGDGLKVTGLVLDAVTPGEGKLLRQLVASALRVQQSVTASPGGVMRISRRSGCAPYEVLVTPISDTTLGFSFDGPLAAVFVRDPDARILTPTDRLQHLYGLTSAEARLMQALLAGDTLDVIAEHVGVSRETLRSQLKAVFHKTGTSSQIGLIRLGLRGLAAFKK